MKEIFKKVDECANYVHDHMPHDSNAAVVILGTSDITDGDEKTLVSINGKGVNLVDLLINTFTADPSLMRFAKDAISVVEGKRVMANMERARRLEGEEGKEGKGSAIEAFEEILKDILKRK